MELGVVYNMKKKELEGKRKVVRKWDKVINLGL
jgi:hypothetical protein